MSESPIIFDAGIPTARVQLDRARVLRLDMNALAAMEQALAVNLLSAQGGARLQSLSYGELATVVGILARDEDPAVSTSAIGRHLKLDIVPIVAQLIQAFFGSAAGSPLS